jgi:hypothetical protein
LPVKFFLGIFLRRFIIADARFTRNEPAVRRSLTRVGEFRVACDNGTILLARAYLDMAGYGVAMMKFLLWCILLVLCWPLAILALVLYPIVWLLLLPFRLLGIAVDGVLELLRAIFLLPARILRGPRMA